LQQQMSRSKNPLQQLIQIRNHMAQMQKDLLKVPSNQNPFRVASNRKDVDIEMASDVKVRLMQLPANYDENGNLLQSTPQQLKELKGTNSSLPGYEGKTENLSPGQTVKVTLARKKSVPMEKGKEKDKELPVESTLHATMIVIVSESTTSVSVDKKK